MILHSLLVLACIFRPSSLGAERPLLVVARSGVSQTARVAAQNQITPQTAYPKLSHVSLGFKDSDIVSIDQERLKQGFVILLDAQGTPRYELPLRMKPGSAYGSKPDGRIVGAYLSKTHVYVAVASLIEFDLLSFKRPAGTIDATLPMEALDVYMGRKGSPEFEANRLLGRLADGFVSADVRKNAAAMANAINKRRLRGDYLSEGDDAVDMGRLKAYVLDALNDALSASRVPSGLKPAQFERPFVQMRNLSVAIEGTSPGAADARRAYDYFALMTRLFQINWGGDGDIVAFSPKASGVARIPDCPPFNEFDALTMKRVDTGSVSDAAWKFKAEVQSDGSLRYFCDDQWKTFKPS